MLKLNYIRVLKKLGMIFLTTLLCLLLIFNAGIIDCFAVAGVDDALLFLLTAVLASCGISFVTYEAAEAGTSALYDNMDTATQSMIDTVAEQIQEKLLVGEAFSSIGVSFWVSGWDNIVKAIAATFGTYVGITAHQAILSSGLLKVNEPLNFIVNGVSANNAISLSLGNATINYIGGSSSATLPSFVDIALSDNHIGRCIDISGFTFALDMGSFSLDDTFNLEQSLSYTVPNGLENATYIDFFGNEVSGGLHQLYFNGLEITRNYIDYSLGTFTWNYVSTGANIVTGNMLGDMVLNNSICADGIWTNKSWSDWLNDQIFGVGVGSLPGNPSIDTSLMPGNDVWHDGSINDDIAIGNPTIGIAVPTTGDDVISLNPDIARDYTATDTKLDDIAGDISGDTTGESSGDTTGNPPKKGNTGALPALSLPEVLFKEKFPFCLPWDLYSLFAMLSAEPVVPKFEIPFTIERLGINEAIIIDFSQFEEQIEIIRFFIGAGFVLSLILISRKMIGAG